MKKLTTLFATIIFFISCDAQTTQTLHGDIVVDRNFKSTVVTGTKLDTVRVIMLVSDTGYIRPMNHDGWQPCPPHEIRYYREPPVHWYFGYLVIVYRGLTTILPPPHPIYLDEKKNLLPKNIVVWQSKIIN